MGKTLLKKHWIILTETFLGLPVFIGSYKVASKLVKPATCTSNWYIKLGGKVVCAYMARNMSKRVLNEINDIEYNFVKYMKQCDVDLTDYFYTER